jgi:hypothetical protein
MIDDNYDGKIQENELKGMMASLKPRFKDLDTDKRRRPRPGRTESGNGSGAMMPRDLRDADIDL